MPREHKRISKKGIESHAGRHGDRGVCKNAGHQGRQCGHETGDGDQSCFVHAGDGQDVRIDKNDVGHRQKGRASSDYFCKESGFSFAEFKKLI